jgi:hypothetical protein
MKKSIIFVSPDYHCSFFYRNELRKMGWRADIYVPPNYPALMLFDKPDFEYRPITGSQWLLKSHRFFWQISIFFFILFRYKYHFYHCGIDQFSFGETKLPFVQVFDRSFRIHLWLSKLLGRKIIHMPSGVPDEEMPEEVEKLGNKEEGVKTEDPDRMRIWFDMLRRYVDINLGYGHIDSSQYKATHIKYKVLDMKLFSPDIEIPDRLRLPPTKKLRILHSFMFGKDRLEKYKGNIKGTKYVQEAMDRLIGEGYPVEFMFFDRVPANDYRFIQIQADIVVEELIRGGWGSTALECIALEKPVITYVRPEWEAFYYQCFPETKPFPFINANKHNIYDVLKSVVTDEDFRRTRAKESRVWAEKHLDPVVNVKAFSEILLKG